MFSPREGAPEERLDEDDEDLAPDARVVFRPEFARVVVITTDARACRGQFAGTLSCLWTV